MNDGEFLLKYKNATTENLDDNDPVKISQNLSLINNILLGMT